MGPLALAWLTLGLLAPSTAAAQGGHDLFQQAREAYDRGEYTGVVDLLYPLVGGDVPSRAIIDDQILVRESRKYLGAAYVLTSRSEEAERQFDALLRGLAPRDLERYRLDAATFPSEVHTVFDRIRGRIVAELQAQERDRQEEAAQREAQRREAVLALYSMAQEAEVEVESDPLLSYIPFGVGQIQNRNLPLGTFFLVSESLLSLSSFALLGTYLGYLDLYEDILAFRSTADGPTVKGILEGLTVANWVSFGITALLLITGVVESVVNYVPRRTIRRQREVDPEILERLELVGAPGGLGLGIRF